ncbi:nucleoside-diphosphate kinase [Streptomyces sp. NPDC002004]
MTPGTERSLSASLSADRDKRTRYAEDTYVQESTGQLAGLTGDVDGFARDHGVLLLKPDAVRARRLTAAIDWLEQGGYRIVCARRVLLDRHMVRALWYFQWNIASPERRRVADLLTTSCPSLVLVVRGAARPDVPVPVDLTHRKGPTDPGRRAPGQLRYVLGRYTYLLNLVHTADEPADVLRELGVYFAEDERADVFAEALDGRDRGGDARALADRICRGAGARSLALGDAVVRLDQDAGALLDRGGLPAEARRALAEARGRIHDEGDDGVAALLRTAWRHRLPLDDWSVVVAGAWVLPMRRPGGTALLEGVPPERWRRHTEAAHRTGPTPAMSRRPAEVNHAATGVLPHRPA